MFLTTIQVDQSGGRTDGEWASRHQRLTGSYLRAFVFHAERVRGGVTRPLACQIRPSDGAQGSSGSWWGLEPLHTWASVLGTCHQGCLRER